MFRPSDNHLAYFRTFPCVDVQNCTISDTKTAVVPVHEATFRVGGTDFGVLNDDVFNSENRLSARGFLPPPIELSYKFKLLTLMVELS